MELVLPSGNGFKNYNTSQFWCAPFWKLSLYSVIMNVEEVFWYNIILNIIFLIYIEIYLSIGR